MKHLILIIAIINVFSFASSFQVRAFTDVIKEEGTFLISDSKNVEKQSKKATEKMENKIAEIGDYFPNTEEDIRAGEEAIQQAEMTPEAILIMTLIVFGAFYVSINHDRRRNAANKKIDDYI